MLSSTCSSSSSFFFSSSSITPFLLQCADLTQRLKNLQDDYIALQSTHETVELLHSNLVTEKQSLADSLEKVTEELAASKQTRERERDKECVELRERVQQLQQALEQSVRELHVGQQADQVKEVYIQYFFDHNGYNYNITPMQASSAALEQAMQKQETGSPVGDPAVKDFPPDHQDSRPASPDHIIAAEGVTNPCSPPPPSPQGSPDIVTSFHSTPPDQQVLSDDKQVCTSYALRPCLSWLLLDQWPFCRTMSDWCAAPHESVFQEFLFPRVRHACGCFVSLLVDW